MESIISLFDINTTFFTIFDYPMSYLEFFGTIFLITCVVLTTKAKILSWPVGLIGCILYMFLFYQIQLYSDLLEQVYFLITGIIGWAMWVHKKDEMENNNTVKVGMNSLRTNVFYIMLVILGTIILSYITMHLNAWWPQYFPEPVSLPVLDALTTVLSFVAQWLLINKKLESWVLWIIVDFIGVGLYWYKGVKFISVEYLLFFGIAIYGLFAWIRLYKLNKSANVESKENII